MLGERWRGPTAWVVLGLVVLVAVGGVVLVRRGSGGEPTAVLSSTPPAGLTDQAVEPPEQPAPETQVSVAPEAMASTTTSPITATTTRASRPTGPRPTVARPPATTPPPAAASLSQGTWLVDAESGTTRRILDAVPSAAAGDRIWFGRGLDVYVMPITGGEATKVRTEPRIPNPPGDPDRSTERVSRIWPSQTGAMLVQVSVQSGGGTSSQIRFYAPDGRMIESDVLTTWAWSPDGSVLAMSNPPANDRIRFLTPEGTEARPSLPADPGAVLLWSADGGSLHYPRYRANLMQRLDLRTGETRDYPPGYAGDPGPDGRVATTWVKGTRSKEVVSLAYFRPDTGAFDKVDAPAQHPLWSPGGATLAVFDHGPVLYAMNRMRIVTPDGATRRTFTTDQRFHLDGGGRTVGGTRWVDARTLVVTVAPVDA